MLLPVGVMWVTWRSGSAFLLVTGGTLSTRMPAVTGPALSHGAVRVGEAVCYSERTTPQGDPTGCAHATTPATPTPDTAAISFPGPSLSSLNLTSSCAISPPPGGTVCLLPASSLRCTHFCCRRAGKARLPVTSDKELNWDAPPHPKSIQAGSVHRVWSPGPGPRRGYRAVPPPPPSQRLCRNGDGQGGARGPDPH